MLDTLPIAPAPADLRPLIGAAEADRNVRRPDRLLVIEADRLIEWRIDRAVSAALHAAGDSAFANLRDVRIDSADMRRAVLAALRTLEGRR